MAARGHELWGAVGGGPRPAQRTTDGGEARAPAAHVDPDAPRDVAPRGRNMTRGPPLPPPPPNGARVGTPPHTPREYVRDDAARGCSTASVLSPARAPGSLVGWLGEEAIEAGGVVCSSPDSFPSGRRAAPRRLASYRTHPQLAPAYAQRTRLSVPGREPGRINGGLFWMDGAERARFNESSIRACWSILYSADQVPLANVFDK